AAELQWQPLGGAALELRMQERGQTITVTARERQIELGRELLRRAPVHRPTSASSRLTRSLHAAVSEFNRNKIPDPRQAPRPQQSRAPVRRGAVSAICDRVSNICARLSAIHAHVIAIHARARSAELRADHRDERDVTARSPTEVVREAEPRIGQLPLSRLAPELQPALVEHPQAAGTNGMAEGLQAAVRVHRQPAAELERTVQNVLPRLA